PLDLVAQLTALEAVHNLVDAALDGLAVGLLGGGKAHVELSQPVVVLAALVLARSTSFVAGLEVGDSEDALGSLPACVVDVVLHLDVVAHRREDPGDGVAQDYVAEVPYVRLLVGV